MHLLALAATAVGLAAAPPQPLLSYSVGSPLREGGLCLTVPGRGPGVRLTRSHDDRDGTWSPDGTQIAFVRAVERRDTVFEILVADADGRHVRNVSRGYAFFNLEPSWSPDGRRIVFVNAWHGSGITVMRADGSQKRMLVGGPEAYSDPSFSRDGRLLLFTRGNGAYTVPATGGPETLLVADARDASWSRVGRSLAFVRGDRIFVADADGRNARAVSPPAFRAAHPRWSPNGSRIAYEARDASDPASNAPASIRVVRPDGSGDRVAVSTPRGAYAPAWRPARPFTRRPTRRCRP